MRIRCPLCQNVHNVPGNLSGMVVACPQCGKPFFAEPIPEDVTEGYRPCPFCREQIRTGATRCRWCHGVLPGGAQAQSPVALPVPSAAAGGALAQDSAAASRDASSLQEIPSGAQEEETLFALHPSWKRLVAPMAAVTLVILCTIPFLKVLERGMYVVLALVALGVLWFLSQFVEILTTTYLLSNQRLAVRTGLFRRQEVEVGVRDIRAVWLNQNLWERILNYGDVVVGTAATAGTEVTIVDVDAPAKALAFFRRQKEADGAAQQPPAAQQMSRR